MFLYNIIYELNHTYMTANYDGDGLDSDYRLQMINNNHIDGLMVPSIRNINNEQKLYFDITERESLLHLFTTRDATYEEIVNLFKCLMRTADELERYLLEESDLMLFPELIFRNVKTGQYEFTFVPDRDESTADGNGIKALLEFIMSKVNAKDEKAVETIYMTYEIAQSTTLRIKTLYETAIAITREESTDNEELVMEEVPVCDEEPQNDDVLPKQTKYIPSVKEVIAGLLAFAGIVLLCVFTYLEMIGQ